MLEMLLFFVLVGLIGLVVYWTEEYKKDDDDDDDNFFFGGKHGYSPVNVYA